MLVIILIALTRTAAVISLKRKGQIDGEKCNRKKRNQQIRYTGNQGSR